MFHRLRFLVSIALALSVFAPLLCAQGGTEQKRIKLIATADTHAEVLPRDHFSMYPANIGWTRLASAIRSEKEKGATLLVDCGDALQGSPLAYIQRKMHPDSPNAMIEIMNGLEYRAMVPGGHDSEFGLAALREARNQAEFPFLAANLLDSAGNLLFTPFTKVTVDGISIAVLGLSLATSPDASDAPGRATFLVRDLIETATEWVPVLRNKEKADAVVVLMHIGVNGLNGQRYDQNAAFSLLDAVPGIDAVVASQAHRPMVARHKGVPVVQPAPFGGSLASILFTFQRTGKQWTLKSSEPGEIPMDHTFKVDPTVLRQTKSLLVETEEYLNTFATRLGNDLDGRWSTVEPTALLQLVHDVQKKATGAQLCAVPSPGTHIFVQNGPTSVRQFYALAPHEDRIAMIQITGAQLRAYLEHAAKHFNFSHLPELINESVPIEDYDVLGGCSYALDISRPPGKRVTSLKFGGKPVEDSLTFTMAITSSRLAGAGGYMEAIGFNGRHQTISKETLRNLLLEYVLATPSLNIRITGDWRTIPFLDRSRVTGAYK